MDTKNVLHDISINTQTSKITKEKSNSKERNSVIEALEKQVVHLEELVKSLLDNKVMDREDCEKIVDTKLEMVLRKIKLEKNKVEIGKPHGRA